MGHLNFRQLAVPLNILNQTNDKVYQCDPGTIYILCHQTMSNSDTWITCPDTFMPERWIRDSTHHQQIHPFLSLPFGFGPRMCIGRRLAMMEISVMVSKIISKYDVSWDGADLEIKTDILVFPDSPLSFKFIKR